MVVLKNSVVYKEGAKLERIKRKGGKVYKALIYYYVRLYNVFRGWVSATICPMFLNFALKQKFGTCGTIEK